MSILTKVSSAFVVALLAAALVPSANAGQPTLNTYKAMIHVAGGVTQTIRYDNLNDCLPGQSWTITDSGDVNIRDNFLIETYMDQSARTTNAVDKGGAQNKGTVTQYEETNFCPPDDPVELEKPKCNTNSGWGVAGLVPDARRGPRRVSIGISRKGGDDQELDCLWGPSTRPTPIGSRISPLDSSYDRITLPLDIKVGQLHNLGVKKKLIRTIRVGGTCDEPIIYRGKKIPTDTEHLKSRECVVDGDFVVTIKRLNRSSKRGVPVA